MQNWTKEHARFVGRIIFANFLKLPLENYRDFIRETERCANSVLTTNVLSKAKIFREPKRSKAVAKIERVGEEFSIRYTYGGFNRIYITRGSSPLFYKLRRISSRNEVTHRIIEGIISHQRKYLPTGNPIDLVPFRQVQIPVDNSWTSRLVNSLSVVTPSGEEKPLKWFFQTKKDINKRLIKQLLDRENEDLQSGKLKKPLTDNQLRDTLEREYNLLLSRWAVGHCRKDMGIPSFKRRLSGYKYPPLSASFSMLYPLVSEEVLRNAPESPGIYELRLRGREAEYPNGKTQVVYIGSTRNIRKRMREHLGKNSKNGHIKDYLKKYGCSFRYIQVPEGWKQEEKRLYGLFTSTYGVPPKCNRVRP